MRVANFIWVAAASVLLLTSQCGEKKYTFQKIKCVDRPHVRNIYTPCRQFMFNVKFWDSDYTLISDSRVLLSMTGEALAMMRGEQIEGIYQYEYDESEIDRISAFNINKTLPDTGWVQQVSQGLAEDYADVWMTPFRHNQFKFTQVSPYPSVNLPLDTAKQWTSNLIMYDGWGDWDNQQLISKYDVIDQGLLELPFARLSGVWHINSAVEINMGVNELDFWFHEDFGFVKMIYKNYAGQLLQFELIEVIEMAQ